MPIQQPRGVFRPAFLKSWLLITTISAFPLGCVGFGFSYYRSPATIKDWINFAQWCVVGAGIAQVWAIPLAILLAWIWMRAVERLATKPADGRNCPKCDYDLTGNTTGRCPECGQETSSQFVVTVDASRLWRAWIVYGVAFAGVVAAWYYWFWR